MRVTTVSLAAATAEGERFVDDVKKTDVVA